MPRSKSGSATTAFNVSSSKKSLSALPRSHDRYVLEFHEFSNTKRLVIQYAGKILLRLDHAVGLR